VRHPTPARTPGGDPLAGPADLRIEALRGWMLPLLQGPGCVDLQPLLQRSLLLQEPERLLHALVQRPPLAPEVLVAYTLPERIHGLSVVRRLNRSGSCWGVEQLRVCAPEPNQAGAPTPAGIEAALLREALHRCRDAASWIATVPTTHDDRLALLREQGFQPLLQRTLWRWEPARSQAGTAGSAVIPPADLQQRPLTRRSAALLWHLEQAACPAQLRQLLDRRVEDLLDHSEGRGQLWIDPSRQQAVAGVRRLRLVGGGLRELELTVHPGWSHLLGEALERLLIQVAGSARQVRLRSESDDSERACWLARLGAVEEGEELVMARSVWRRADPQLASSGGWRFDTVLDTLNPRRRPVPTPLLPSPGLTRGTPELVTHR
jgi:hypothetical protein